MGTKNDGKSLHSGHRDRMRSKAMKYGFDSFHNHEVLEMLLYSVIPQKDTNPIAHELIETFGSFHAVFEAPIEDLCKVKGITTKSAFLIKMIPSLTSFYIQDKNNVDNVYIKDSQSAFDYLYPHYINKTVEVASVLIMNNAGKLLAFEMLNEGTVNTAEIHSRKIIEICIKYNATQIILCHNHPSGVAVPSMDDFITTRNVNTALKAINAKLVDHIIIANNDYVTMSQSHQFKNAFK